MALNAAILAEHLRLLSIAYPVSITDDDAWLIIHGFMLPPGFNCTHSDVLLEVPTDYPLTPPGVAARLYVRPDLRYQGHVIKSFYVKDLPRWGKWGWLCYRGIRWDPCSDNLVTLMEMIRADLTKPPIKQKEPEL